MHTLAPANAITVSQTADLWHLQRNGQTLAVIERAWDDHHWLLFLADGHGELVCQGAVGRIVTLKVCLTLWARRNAVAFPFLNDDQSEWSPALGMVLIGLAIPVRHGA